MKKSDITRSRILEVATRLFATQGYSATGFRQIARDSEVSLNTITYHFGSKDLLYREAISIVAERHLANADYYSDVPEGGFSAPQDAANALGRIVRRMARASLLPENRWEMGFIMRALMDGRQDEVNGILERIHAAEDGLLRIVKTAPNPLSDRDFRFWQRQLRAQLLFFASSHVSVCMEFGLQEYTPEFVDEIANNIAANCALAIQLPKPA